MEFLEKFNSNKFTYTFFSVAFFVMLLIQAIIAYLDTTYTRMFFVGGTTVALLVALGNLYFWWDDDTPKIKVNSKEEKVEVESLDEEDILLIEALERNLQGGK